MEVSINNDFKYLNVFTKNDSDKIKNIIVEILKTAPDDITLSDVYYALHRLIDSIVHDIM